MFELGKSYAELLMRRARDAVWESVDLDVALDGALDNRLSEVLYLSLLSERPSRSFGPIDGAINVRVR